MGIFPLPSDLLHIMKSGLAKEYLQTFTNIGGNVSGLAAAVGKIQSIALHLLRWMVHCVKQNYLGVPYTVHTTFLPFWQGLSPGY